MTTRPQGEPRTTRRGYDADRLERAVTGYPWEVVERVSRDAVARARRIRRAADSLASRSGLEAALSELLAAEVELLWETPLAAPAAPPLEGTLVAVRLRELDAVLWVEPDLVHAAVVRALARKPGMAAPEDQPDPALAGALAAIVVEALRRSSQHVPILLRAPPDLANALRLDVTVFLDGKPYRTTVWVRDEGLADPTPWPASLRAAGAFPVSVPVVAACCVASRDEMAALAPGDVFVPDTWWATPAKAGSSGHVIVAAPRSERGARFQCSDTGDLVVTGEAEALSADPPAGAMPEPSDTITDNVLELPVVVRVEIGSVTLTAREWADLRPGDIIETARRISEPVVLRVAGREVARGELVDVDGAVGVRIREILGSGE